MNPYVKLVLKCLSVLIAGFGAYSSAHQVLALDTNLVPFLMSGFVPLAAYLGGVADSTPAPWNDPTPRADALRAAVAMPADKPVDKP